MEVLISMFVLAIGLMGVAALIPAGRHEIVEATKLETAAMVGRGAFRDMQIRGYLNPANWNLQPTNSSWQPVYDPASNGPVTPFMVRNTGGSNSVSDQAAYVIDPLARTASAGDYGRDFPGLHSTDPTLVVPRLMRVMPLQVATANVAQAQNVYDNIFRSSVDLNTEPNAINKDLPPLQVWFKNGTNPLRRMSDGNYSWLATMVSDPSRLGTSGDVTVSVAVFYKRVLAKTPSNEPMGEYVATVNQFPLEPTPNVAVQMVRMPSGGEVILGSLPVNPITNKLVSLKPGQWIMLAGFRQVGTVAPFRNLNYYHWYRVLSAANPDATTNTQRLTLAGQDWNIVAPNSQAYLFDNIISVYEKNLALEIQ